jgi:aerobic carbon-monoxide dehydrogenase large subunit
VEPGVAHVVFARSPVAHGTITSIDVSVAEGMPGVIAVYRADEGHDLGLAPFQGFPMIPAEVNRPVFARDRVRFVGDIVAAVVAGTREQAADAADAVLVDYDPLPAVTTAAAALDREAPILFPEHGSNVCFATTFGEDVDALEGAEAVAELTMVSQRLAGVPMECNALLAVPGEPNGGVTCWVSHQAPHAAHAAMAPVLRLEPDQLRIVCPWVGGGFGPKAAVYVEYVVAGLPPGRSVAR